MKKFLVFMFILFSSQAHSFKGQPRELIVMESVSQKTTLEFFNKKSYLKMTSRKIESPYLRNKTFVEIRVFAPFECR